MGDDRRRNFPSHPALSTSNQQAWRPDDRAGLESLEFRSSRHDNPRCRAFARGLAVAVAINSVSATLAQHQLALLGPRHARVVRAECDKARC